jgi:uncharacterized RDD family membrane protein YckC
VTEHQNGPPDGTAPTDPTALPPQAWDPPAWPPPSWPGEHPDQPFAASSTPFVPTSPWVAAPGHPADTSTVTGHPADTSAAADHPADVAAGATAPARRSGGSRRAASRRSRPVGGAQAAAAGTAPLAGWAPRAGAALLDAAVTLVPGGALLVGGTAAATSGSGGAGLLLVAAGYLGLLGVGLWNHVLRQGRSGRTVGKSLVGLRLVGPEDDAPVGEGVTAVRALAHVLDTLPLGVGWLWPLVDAERRTVADAVCGTRVVRA